MSKFLRTSRASAHIAFLCTVLTTSMAGSYRTLAGVAGTTTTEEVMTEPLLPERSPIASYASYVNSHSGFSLDVPAGWAIQWHLNRDNILGPTVWYSVTGPPDSASHVGFTELELRVIPTARFGGVLAGLTDFVDASRHEQQVAAGTFVIDSPTTFMAGPAHEFRLEYQEDRPEATEPGEPPVLVTVIRQWLLFERGNTLYELALVTTAADIDLYQAAYDTARSTFGLTP